MKLQSPFFTISEQQNVCVFSEGQCSTTYCVKFYLDSVVLPSISKGALSDCGCHVPCCLWGNMLNRKHTLAIHVMWRL